MFTSCKTLTEGLQHNGPGCGDSQVNSQGILPTQHGLQWPFLLLCVLLTQSYYQLFATPWNVTHQAYQSTRFCRQEYWSGLPCPSSGNLLDPGIKPRSTSYKPRQILYHLSYQGSPKWRIYPFLKFFLSLCRSKFLARTFSSKKSFEHFLQGSSYRQQILSVCVCLSKFLSLVHLSALISNSQLLHNLKELLSFSLGSMQ